jgi:hypothetical protein
VTSSSAQFHTVIAAFQALSISFISQPTFSTLYASWSVPLRTAIGAEAVRGDCCACA